MVFVPQPPPSKAQVSTRQQQNACDAIWCATLTVGYIDASGTDTFGWNHLANYPNSALTDAKFEYEGETYEVSHIRVLGSPGATLEIFLDTPGTDDIEDQAIRDKLSLHVGNDAFNLGGGTYNDVQKKIAWSSSVPTWADQDMVALKMYATPEFKRATVDGVTMTVTFTTQLDDASEPAGSAFTVNVAGSPVSVTNVAVSGQTATLTLAQAVSFGQAVTVSYAKPSTGPLQNPAGTAAPDFSSETVFNHTLPAPCDALWCAVLTVGFYDNGFFQYLGWIDTYGDLSDKEFTYDGQTYGIGEVYTANPGDFLWLDFIDTQHGDIDNAATREKLNLYVNDVAFHIGASGTYRDVPKGISWTSHGLSWSNGAIVELRIDDRPLFESAVVDGDTMTLTFDLPLDSASEPVPGAFTVNVAGSPVSVTNVDVSGQTATLTLGSPVTFGQTVTVSYTKPAANPLQGSGGRDVTTFANQDVTIACPIWCATLTVDEQAISGQTHFGWSSGPEFAQASLTDEVFNFAGNEYHVDGISFRDDNNLLSLSFSTLHPGDIDSQATRIRLAVDIDGTTVLNLGEGTFASGSKSVTWTQDVGWTDGRTIQLQIVEVLGPVLSISRSASPIKEARNAEATFTVTRSHLTSGWTTANLGWSRTGDYLDCSRGCRPHHDAVQYDSDGNSIGQLPTSPVFAPGETTKTIAFNIHDDNEYEQPGCITMFLRQPTIPGNEYGIDPARQSATVEVHSHGERGGPLGTFGDRWPPILAHIEVPPVPEKNGQYRVYVHLRMAPSVSFARRTYTAQINEDIPIVPSFSFTISTRGQLARPTDDYGALSHGVLFQQRECDPPTVVNDCWSWDGQTWRNTHAVDVTSAITSHNHVPIVSDGVWENHEYLDIVIERSPGLYGSIRFEEGVQRQLPLWIMDTGPAGDPGLTADWTPTGVDLAWDDAIWSATMQVGYTRDVGAKADVYGWDAGSIIPDDSLSDMHFDHAGQTYEVDIVTTLVVPGATTLVLGFPDDSQYGDIASQSTRNNLDLHVGDQVFNLGAAHYEDRTKTVQWGDAVLTAWAVGDTVPLKITPADSTLYNPPAGSEWQFTVWRRNLSDSQSAPYEQVTGSIGVYATTDSFDAVDGTGEAVNGIGKLNLVEYVVEGIAYAGGTKVDLWASPKRLFRPHHVRDRSVNTDAASHSGVVAPGHPTGLKAEVDSQNFVTLEWVAPAQGPVTGYKICRTDVADVADLANYDTCENSIEVSGGDTLTHRYLPNVVTLHEYRVIAVNAARGQTVEGGSTNAVRANRRLSTDKPSSPVVTGSSRMLHTDGSYSVTLNWGSVPDATGYVVRRWLYSEVHGPIRGLDEQGRPQSGSQKMYTVSGGSTTTYTDTQDLVAGERYQYRVYATNTAGTGNPSPYIRVGLYDLDSSESRLTAKTQSAPNAVQLDWNVPSSDGTYDSFQVWRRALKGDDNDWKMLVVDTGSLTAPYAYTDSDVDAGAEYEYRIFAADGTRHWTSPAASAEIIRD